MFFKQIHLTYRYNLTLTDTTTLGQSSSGSNGNEGVLHTSQNSRTGASPSDAV